MENNTDSKCCTSSALPDDMGFFIHWHYTLRKYSYDIVTNLTNVKTPSINAQCRSMPIEIMALIQNFDFDCDLLDGCKRIIVAISQCLDSAMSSLLLTVYYSVYQTCNLILLLRCSIGKWEKIARSFKKANLNIELIPGLNGKTQRGSAPGEILDLFHWWDIQIDLSWIHLLSILNTEFVKNICWSRMDLNKGQDQTARCDRIKVYTAGLMDVYTLVKIVRTYTSREGTWTSIEIFSIATSAA